MCHENVASLFVTNLFVSDKSQILFIQNVYTKSPGFSFHCFATVKTTLENNMQHNCCKGQNNVGSVILCAHVHTGMSGMYNVADRECHAWERLQLTVVTS